MKCKNIDTVILSIIFFLLPFLSLAINNDTSVNGFDLDILPIEILNVYYPFGSMYKIPESDKASKYLRKAYSYEKFGDLHQAYMYYSYAYRRVRNTPQAPYILFKRVYTISDERAFIKDLKDILQEYPDFPLIDAVEFEISSLLYLKGSLDESMYYIDNIIKKDDSPFIPYALTLKAQIYFKKGNYEGSINSFLKSISKLKDTASGNRKDEKQLMDSYIGLARCSLENNSLKESEIILRKVYGTTTIKYIKGKALFYLFELYKYLNKDKLAMMCYFRLNRELPNSIYLLKIKKKYSYEGVPLSYNETGDSIAIQDKSILKGIDSIDNLVSLKNENSVQVGNKDKVKSGFSVQVGSFKKRKNSEGMVQKISKYGYPVYIKDTKIDGTPLFRVRVGPFDIREKALNALEGLKKYSIEGYLVKER